MKIVRRLEALAMFVGGAALVVASLAFRVWWPIVVLSIVSGASACVVSIAVWIIAGEIEQAEDDIRSFRSDAKNKPSS